MTQPTLNQEIIQPALETIYVGPVFFLSSIAAMVLFYRYFYVDFTGRWNLFASGLLLIWMGYFLVGISYFFFSFKG